MYVILTSYCLYSSACRFQPVCQITQLYHRLLLRCQIQQTQLHIYAYASICKHAHSEQHKCIHFHERLEYKRKHICTCTPTFEHVIYLCAIVTPNKSQIIPHILISVIIAHLPDVIRVYVCMQLSKPSQILQITGNVERPS